MSGSTKTNASFLIVMAAFTLTAGFFLYTMGKKYMERRNISFVNAMAQVPGSDHGTYIRQHGHSLGILARDDSFAKLVSMGPSDPAYPGTFAEVKARMEKRIEVDEHVLELSVLDIDGTILTSTIEQRVGTTRSVDKTYLIDLGTSHVTQVHMSRYCRKPVMTVVIPVSFGGRTVGAVTAELDAMGTSEIVPCAIVSLDRRANYSPVEKQEPRRHKSE